MQNYKPLLSLALASQFLILPAFASSSDAQPPRTNGTNGPKLSAQANPPQSIRVVNKDDLPRHEGSWVEIKGDIFAGDSQAQIADIDDWCFSEVGDEDADPFASGRPARNSHMSFTSPHLNITACVPSAAPFLQRMSSPPAFQQANANPRRRGKSRNGFQGYTPIRGINLGSTGDEDIFTGYAGGSDVFSSSGTDYFSSAARAPQLHGMSLGIPSGRIAPNGLHTRTTMVPGSSCPSYTPSKPRWDFKRMPVRIYVSKTVEDARKGYVQALIYDAFRDWSKASGNKVRFTVTYNFRDADIYFVAQGTDSGQWAEHSTEFHKGMFDRVRVSFINETLHDLEPRRLRAVCLHETGHALGLLEHSKVAGDVMSLSAPDDFHPAIALSRNDISVFCKLYKQ